MNANEEIYEFDNGRTYRVIDTGKPYIDKEYHSGGFVIHTMLGDNWCFICNSPDRECIDYTLKALKRMSKRMVGDKT